MALAFQRIVCVPPGLSPHSSVTPAPMPGWLNDLVSFGPTLERHDHVHGSRATWSPHVKVNAGGGFHSKEEGTWGQYTHLVRKWPLAGLVARPDFGTACPRHVVQQMLPFSPEMN